MLTSEIKRAVEDIESKYSPFDLKRKLQALHVLTLCDISDHLGNIEQTLKKISKEIKIL